MIRKWTHPYPLSMFRRPPEEVLQNVFHVCQGQVADHAGDVFDDTRWDIVLYGIQKLNRNNRRSRPRRATLSCTTCSTTLSRGASNSPRLSTRSGPEWPHPDYKRSNTPTEQSRVSALFTMVYSIMYNHVSTDRSNSLLTSTRDTSKC